MYAKCGSLARKKKFGDVKKLSVVSFEIKLGRISD